MNKLILSVFLLIFCRVSFSADLSETSKSVKKTKSVQEAPKVKPGFVPRAEITIIESKDTMIKEYHIAGKLRAIKVTPKNGMPAYYLIDRVGNGVFEKLGPDMGPQVVVPNWIFFEW